MDNKKDIYTIEVSYIDDASESNNTSQLKKNIQGFKLNYKLCNYKG